jgi:hypothetical protein
MTASRQGRSGGDIYSLFKLPDLGYGGPTWLALAEPGWPLLNKLSGTPVPDLPLE